MKKNRKKIEKLNNESGQAIFEMVLFFPLLILLFLYFLKITASINGAINQQKITRGYFYARLKNNSYYPFYQDAYQGNWVKFGMSFIGWNEKFNAAQEPLLPCYQAKVPMFSTEETDCSPNYKGSATSYIRVGTVYGVCGANFETNSSGEYQRGFVSSPGDIASWAACTIR